MFHYFLVILKDQLFVICLASRKATLGSVIDLFCFVFQLQSPYTCSVGFTSNRLIFVLDIFY